MWGSDCECRSQPPVPFRQHSIPPQAIFPTINTSSSATGWTIFGGNSSDVSGHRWWTSADPCWVRGQCSASPPQTNSLKTPPCSGISHCKKVSAPMSGMTLNPGSFRGVRSIWSPFFGSGGHLLEAALSCHIPSPSQNSCQTDIVLPHSPAELLCPLLSPQGLELLIPNH